MIYGHCTEHSHLLIVIIGTDTMDQSLKGGLAHGAGGGHLRPLYYAAETERVCARVKDHYIGLLYFVHRYISQIHTILAVGTQFVCIGCSHPTIHTLSYLGVPGFARLLASVPPTFSSLDTQGSEEDMKTGIDKRLVLKILQTDGAPLLYGACSGRTLSSVSSCFHRVIFHLKLITLLN